METNPGLCRTVTCGHVKEFNTALEPLSYEGHSLLSKDGLVSLILVILEFLQASSQLLTLANPFFSL